MMPIVEVSHLRKSYGGVEAVRDVSFTVDEAEVVAILGPNGAGKTTSIEILEGFRRRDGGSVVVLGQDPQHADGHFRNEVGVVLQECEAEPYLCVAEVLRLFAGYYTHPLPIDVVLGIVGLDEKRSARVRSLSGGQRRRLDLALALIGDPRLVFMDEPTTGFDPQARRAAWDAIRRLRERGTTILLTTHSLEEAEALADRLVVIAGGHVVADATPRTLGGRERGRARISFRLPEGVVPADVPVAVRGTDAVWTADIGDVEFGMLMKSEGPS